MKPLFKTTPKPLFKTTLTIWTEYNPDGLDLESLGREADRGSGYCSQWTTVKIDDPPADPRWDGTGVLWEDDSG